MIDIFILCSKFVNKTIKGMIIVNLCYIIKSFSQIDLLRKFAKSNINIIGINSISELKDDYLLVISNKDSEFNEVMKKSTNAFVWEELYNDFYNYSLERYMANYDFYHLKYSLKRAIKPDNEAIVVGSSYALFGIEESVLNFPCVNLALASQDIYYASVIGKYVISQNNNIKRIFIGTGYYSFYNDLSLSQGGELMRLTDVYYPIFKDKHNCKELPNNNVQSLFKYEIFDVEQVLDFFSNKFFEESNGKYFTETRDRFKSRIVFRETKDGKWFELNDSLKEKSAYERADSHNKAIMYMDSYKENIDIMNSFVSFCNERNVKIYLIAFPGTKFYEKYLLKEYKESYASALSLINGEIRFIDFDEFCAFDDKDFVDMDHLDEGGAVKVSWIINNLT
ncbi:hypothetical protein [Clostridium beijerinckii]|uniref:hypothetical protein n=1 Tax=Clostridium beijerinckii TaxID=1520 RepID=UPI000A834102|nr:hypothetical protein [Clostridium beijerinckii]